MSFTFSRTNVARLVLTLTFVGPLAAGCGGGSGSSDASGLQTAAAAAAVSGNTFHDGFAMHGAHAFGNAVWWDQDSWDVRNDTANEAVQPISESDPYVGNYTAITKPGYGAMRVDFQGAESARLRNPMLISAGHPATVSFKAPLFVTTGHWWEVAITPTDKPYAAEYTAIPARQNPESLNDPVTGSPTTGGTTNGPGHRAVVEDSINVISTGWPDGPTCDGSGWHVRWAVTQASNGHVTDHVTPKHRIANLHKVDPDPDEQRELYPWKIVYTPGEIKLLAKLSDHGSMKVIDHWKVHIPWSQVYVNLLDVAYQAGHHPQPRCGMHTHGIVQGQVMEWSDVSVSPVKYARTYALPGPAPLARKTGWLSYDLRDVNAHKGSGQPNSKAYDKYGSYLYCSVDDHGGLPCPVGARKTVNLKVSITAEQLRGLQRAQFIGDVRHAGNVQVTINGHNVGTLRGQPVRPNFHEPGGFVDEFEDTAWVRHGVDIPRGVLHAGVNHVTLHLDQRVDASLDRLQIELDDN